VTSITEGTVAASGEEKLKVKPLSFLTRTPTCKQSYHSPMMNCLLTQLYVLRLEYYADFWTNTINLETKTP
jgi:hypothetical protein